MVLFYVCFSYNIFKKSARENRFILNIGKSLWAHSAVTDVMQLFVDYQFGEELMVVTLVTWSRFQNEWGLLEQSINLL